jgi:phospholipase C
MNINIKRHKSIFIVACITLVAILGIASLLVHNSLTDYHIAAELLTPSVVPFSNPKHQLPLSQIKHVFVIMEENHDWSKIYNNPEAPFMNKTLLVQGAYASQYYNVPKNLHALHPSEPNYILMETGKIAFSDHTFTTNDPPSEKNSTNTKDYFVRLLEKNGLTWKSYQEDIPGTGCPVKNTNLYAAKHNPYVFFQNITGYPLSETNSYCKDHDRPFSELPTGLNSGDVPNYVFITPNLQHDMHDGTIAQADAWLSQAVPMITHSRSFNKMVHCLSRGMKEVQ